ncbi:MAG: DUF2277 family protein [Actinobacteria bacterium]|jgi:hypothetical protein|nr:DUF2277 family protein [Actinomycetota bacterium]
MCRSIKVLRDYENPPTDEEIEAAALQFVRKISGYRQPSKANTEVFELAVQEITESSRRLLDSLQPGRVRVSA